MSGDRNVVDAISDVPAGLVNKGQLQLIIENYHSQINTGGGTYVEGNVNTGGGKFVGRDDNRG